MIYTVLDPELETYMRLSAESYATPTVLLPTGIFLITLYVSIADTLPRDGLNADVDNTSELVLATYTCLLLESYATPYGNGPTGIVATTVFVFACTDCTT